MDVNSKPNRRDALVAGAGAGAAAYVAVYVLTFLLVRGEARRQFGEAVPTWKVVGWYQYNAHFVDLVSSQSIGPLGGAETVSLIAESSGTTGTLLYLLPPLALLAAGAGAAVYLDAHDPGIAATGGAATVLGYGLLVVLGAAAVAHTVEGSFLGVDLSATVRVPVVEALVVAGLLYPAVFGTAGAVAVDRLR